MGQLRLSPIARPVLPIPTINPEKLQSTVTATSEFKGRGILKSIDTKVLPIPSSNCAAKFVLA